MLYKSYKLLGKYEFQAIALGQLPQIGTHRVDLGRAAVSRIKTRAAVSRTKTMELPLPIGTYLYLKSHWQAGTSIKIAAFFLYLWSNF